MKAIHIDSVNRTVKEIEVEGLSTLQEAVGGYIAVGFSFEQDTLFVDDEGLLKGPQHFFTFEGAHQPFAGNGIIIGTDESGESTDTSLKVSEIARLVQFYGLDEIRRLIEAN